MLNFDALGTGSGVSIFGSLELTEMITGTGKKIGVDITITRGLSGGISDCARFEKVGAPHLMGCVLAEIQHLSTPPLIPLSSFSQR